MYLTQNEDVLVKYVSTLYQHIFVITTILNEIRNLLGVNGHCTKHMYVGFLTRVARRHYYWSRNYPLFRSI
jgi:hypothetical protein